MTTASNIDLQWFVLEILIIYFLIIIE